VPERSGSKKGDIIKWTDRRLPLCRPPDTSTPKDPMIKFRLHSAETDKIASFLLLSKNEFFITEFKGIELENIDATDKKRDSTSIMCKNKIHLE
jgi:hypothetical protein